MVYKIHYPEKPNMGDLLNKDMLQDLFHITVERSDALHSNMSAIGSGLYLTQWSRYLSVKGKQIVHYPFANHDYHVWGTGFIKYEGNDSPFYFRNINFHCLRGQLTKERVEKIIGRSLNIPLGDGGLLAERWVGQPSKKYALGIIPHFKEQDHPLIKEMENHYNGAVVIDLKDDPKSVVRKIGECECILSSSLHGLIVADSFHIPNMHILLYKMGDRIMGDGYKFADYYSSYGFEDCPRVINQETFPTIDEIRSNYLIEDNFVEAKKEQLMKAFPM